jgi:putative transposase
VIGGIPPASRNHRVPTGCDTPATAAAPSLGTPRAIASQNRTRSSRRAADGRPGDHIWPRIARIACWRFPAPISPHLQIEVLRRPAEFAQYTSAAFAELAGDCQVTLSMGRKGQCWDNALSESFFSSIKGELLDLQPWPAKAGARRAIVEYIGWFNGTRLHSALGYLSPAELRPQPVRRFSRM